MEQVQIEVLLEAETPIAHHMETIGNIAMLMRRKVRVPGSSEFTTVPYITGDTLRHGLREAGTYALLEAAGMLGEPKFSEAALRLLFAGGMVTGASGGVKLADYDELIDLCPHVALLGGCASNRVVSGKMFVNDGVLVCTENTTRLPEWVHQYAAEHAGGLASCRSHVDRETRVRMDPMLDPSKRLLLTAGAKEAAEQRLLKSENASAHDDAVGKADSKSSMMPRTIEVLVPGSLFFWSFSAVCHTPLDKSTLYTMVSAFMNHCVVGGKKGTGHGKLKPVAARNVSLPRLEDTVRSDGTGMIRQGESLGALFFAHVRERKDKLKSYLESVAA